MLGLADFHKQIPRTLAENKAWRKTVAKDPLLQAEHQARCKADILYYVNGFIVQYNPNAIGEGSIEVGPFITWEIQEKAIYAIIECVVQRRDLLQEKSREMGASWQCLLVMDWFCRFHKHKKFLCVSRNEEMVESADPDSLFWKLDFAHRHLPPWLKGARRRRRRFIGYQDTESFITGQATTDKAGVGGRCTAMFIDEFAQIREGFELNRRTVNTTKCRIFNSTHKGSDTCFAALVDASERLGTPRKIVIHWSQHPDKRRGLYRYDALSGQVEVLDKQYAYPVDFRFNMTEEPAGGPFPGLRSPWYDEQCLRMNNDRRAIAEDLDIDVTGSVSAFFDGRTLAHLKAEFCCPPFWEGDVEYDRDTGEFKSLIPLKDGPLKLWCYPTVSGHFPEDDYGMGGDLSTGVGSTNSCFAGARKSTGEKVLEYAVCTIKPEALAPIACALGRMMRNKYGDPAYFGWEHHGPGVIFGEKVMELGYGRVLMREAQSSFHGGRKKPSMMPGWFPTIETKRTLLEKYRSALEKKRFINRSERAIRECKDYRYTASGTVEHPHDSGGDDPTGARVNHGDRVMADALANKMIEELGGAGKPEANGHQEVREGSLAWRRELHDNERRRMEDWA